MISLRYHAVSIAAVFLALAVGVVLGASGVSDRVLAAVSTQRDDLDGRVVLDSPAAVVGGPAEGDLLVVEEEVLIHAPQLSQEAGVDQDAGPRDPGDGPGPSSPIGLVFPPRAR